MCQAFSLWGYGMMIFLVSKLPDKILTPFPCTLYFTHSKKKNPCAFAQEKPLLNAISMVS